MTESFRPDNTEGYSQDDMDALNAELAALLESHGVEPGSDEAHLIEAAFIRDVSRR